MPVRLADTECTFLLQTNFDRVESTATVEFQYWGPLTNLAGAPPNLCLFSAAAIAFLRIPFVGTFQASGLWLRHGYIIRLDIVKKETASSARTGGSTPGEYICSYIILVRQGLPRCLRCLALIMQLEGNSPSQRHEWTNIGTGSPIVSKSLQDFVYLNPTISSLGYVCHLIAVGGASCIGISRHRERFAASARRFAQVNQ
jgi:hypothetical protein